MRTVHKNQNKGKSISASSNALWKTFSMAFSLYLINSYLMLFGKPDFLARVWVIDDKLTDPISTSSLKWTWFFRPLLICKQINNKNIIFLAGQNIRKDTRTAILTFVVLKQNFELSESGYWKKFIIDTIIVLTQNTHWFIYKHWGFGSS